MTNEKYIQHVWERQMANNSGCLYPTITAIVIFVTLLLSACTTKTVVEYRDRDVNHYITKVEKDTVVTQTHDSVFVSVHTKNDTVFVNKYKLKYVNLDKIKIKHDTCYRDSIIVQYNEKVKEIVKIPKICVLSLVISILCVIFAIIKIVRWLQTC